jgi:hypothetical protein
VCEIVSDFSLGSIVHCLTSPSLPSSFITEAWAAGNCPYSPSSLIYANLIDQENISVYFSGWFSSSQI